MNSIKETILTRWHELSVALKALLSQKLQLKLNADENALTILSELSQLSGEGDLKTLIMTNNVSDAILLKNLLEIANPKLSLELILPHRAEPSINTDEAAITIVPFSLFSLASVRDIALNLQTFNNIILDDAIPVEFLHDLFFANNENSTFLELDNETRLLSAHFAEISNKIAKAIPAQVVTAEPLLREKITLSTHTQESDSQTLPVTTEKKSKTSEKAAKADTKKSAVATKETAPTPELELEAESAPNTSTQEQEAQAPTTSAVASAPAPSKTISLKDKVQASEPNSFIAMVPRNLQRQYIRDYIREHNLQHILIVTHNRQSARLLEKYLYRARIRSRIVHEKIDDDTANSLFERYNNGQFTALILMHRVVEDLAAKIEKCDAVMFLDFPSVYSEYADKVQFVRNGFNPDHLISIASENDKAWVQALFEEYPTLTMPTIDVDITPPKRRNQENNERPADTRKRTKTPHQQKRAPETAAAPTPEADQAAPQVEDPTTAPQTAEAANETPSRQTNRNARQDRNPRNDRNDRNDRPDRSDRNNRNDKREARPTHNNRRRDPQNHNTHHEPGDSQSDFFSANQDEIVNQNRLPFESGSFEANIARENRRRGRDYGNTPGGIGQQSTGNFIQNITQGLNPNQNSNPQSQGRRNNSSGSNNSNNNRTNRARPNNRGRKK